MSSRRAPHPPANSIVAFRELRLSDAPLLFKGAFGLEEVTRYLQWETHRTIEETTLLLQEMVAQHQRNEKYYWLALSGEDERVIGLGSLKSAAETGWIGFLVFRGEQRKGFGSAILSSLEGAALRSFGSASAAVRRENRASVSLLESAGWIKEEPGRDSEWLIYRKICTEERQRSSASGRRSTGQEATEA